MEALAKQMGGKIEEAYAMFADTLEKKNISYLKISSLIS